MNISTIVRRHRVQLDGSVGDTLSRFGSHTRRNLRYYRRRAENELNIEFCEQLTRVESDEAIGQLGDVSAYVDSIEECRAVEEFLRSRPEYFSMGLRAGNQWVSYLVGLRTSGITSVFLQLNHSGFARYSLSTVLRSYLIEREILYRQTEIKFVNGTCPSFQRCCEAETCLTVCAHRGLLASAILEWIAPRHNAADHGLNLHRLASPADGMPA